MQEQAKPNDFRVLIRNEQYESIDHDSGNTVKRVKSNAAPHGVEDRARKQMVEINQHRCEHNNPGFPPTFSKERVSNDPGKEKMERIVENRLGVLEQIDHTFCNAALFWDRIPYLIRYRICEN